MCGRTGSASTPWYRDRDTLSSGHWGSLSPLCHHTMAGRPLALPALCPTCISQVHGGGCYHRTWSGAEHSAVGCSGQPFVFPALGTRGLHLFAPSVSPQPLAMPRRLGWSKQSKTPACSIRQQAQNHVERALWLALGPSKVREFGREENTEVAGRRPGFLVFLPTCRGVVNLWKWMFLGIFPSRLHL